MSGRINATIDLTKVYEMIKANHSSIREGNDGRLRMNVTIWINDEVREFPSKKEGGLPVRQDTGIQLNSRQDATPEEKANKVYVGNGLSTFAAGSTPSANYSAFAGKAGGGTPASAAPPSDDDLPF